MAEHFPQDRFDEIPDLKRVGAHRAPAPKGRGWIAFLCAVLATIVLVGIGTFALSGLNNKVDFLAGPKASATPTATPTATPVAVAPVVDTAADILVMNGTETDGLAAGAIDALAAAGFTQEISTSGVETDGEVATSGIYYQDPAQEGVARAISNALGGIPIQLSDQYKIPVEDGEEPILRVVVVLGTDYVPAG